MKKSLLVLLVAPVLALLGACSSAPPPAAFTIVMEEFSFSPDTLEVRVGQEVTIHLVNDGALAHELMIGRDPVVEEGGLASTYAHNLFTDHDPDVDGAEADQDSHADDDHGFMVLLPSGSEDASFTFTVTEEMVGEWEMGCFTDGGSHYGQGMVGKLVVLP